jgi:hypothetical protein
MFKNVFRAFLPLFLAILCFLQSPVAAASSFDELIVAATEITVPSFAKVGKLTESSPTYYDEDDYYGRTKYAGVYKITLTSNQVAKILLGDADTDLYTYLYVLNEDGELVASDHYSGYGNIDVDGTHYWANNSITLSGSGTYYILASTYDELETGAYAIEVKTITVSSFAELAAASTPITVPSAQIGNLTESSPTYYNDDYGRTKYAGVYKITLTGNQAVEILLGSADTDIDLDTYLYVLDEDGELVESDDERGSGTPINVGNSEYLANSYISLSSSGTYYILASTYNELETGAYAIEVKNLEKPTISTASLPKGYVDESYHRQLVANRPAEWEIASGELPPGLFLYSSGIYGTPEEAGTFTFIVKATNVKGSETKQLSIVIDPPRKPVFLVPNLANGVKDEYYESGIPVSGSNSVELKDGSLPPGLNFDSDCWSNDCEFDIYGVPTQVGTFTFTIVAENDAGTTEKSYSIKIAQELEPPVILTTTLPNGVIDEEYVAQFISGSPATWTLEGGKLPRGLEFIDWLGTGIIYGSPEETGTFNITIKATNEINSDTKQFSLTVGTTTPVIPAIASKANPLKAWMQSGTLYLSGLTAGKAWSIYTAKGTLLHSGTASSAEMNVKLNMASGVYFVKTSGQTLKIMNR